MLKEKNKNMHHMRNTVMGVGLPAVRDMRKSMDANNHQPRHHLLQSDYHS